MKYLQDLNWGTLYFFQYQQQQLPGLTWFLEWLALLGHPLVLLLLLIMAVVILLRTGQHRTVRYLLLLVLVGLVVGEALKWTIAWPRPQTWHGPIWLGPSLPSAPALVSALIFVSLGRFHAAGQFQRQRQILVLAAWFLPALLVGFTQIYLGWHWLWDVVLAWLVAALLIAIVERCRGRAELQSILPSPDSRRAGWR